MKTLVFLAVVSLSVLITGDPIDRIGVKGPITFDDVSYNLAWSDHPHEKYYVQEYLPAGETVERFNQMLTIHLFDQSVKPKNGVNQKVAELNERKKSDPVCNYAVMESPDGKDFLLDFLLSDSKDGRLRIVEFNAYKYKQIEIGDRKALLVFAYSKRAYDDEIEPFLKGLKEERMKHLQQVIKAELPTVTLEK